MLFFGNFLYSTPLPSLNFPLLINAVAILSEDRFLARINLSPASYDPAFGSGADASIKAKIIHLIASVRTIMRMPLIFVNSVIILYELVLG
ncbi:Yos1-like-domain-containing protein [Thelonectria olida]|uniref:Yos1-like-domain-containing protein n=1 Tax=Thelonectria olida TaxID=1576542 RepID=A0A9P8WH34_9HYPO|nr:Yos1-like-domain-containing protein [Thelonectria olida]